MNQRKLGYKARSIINSSKLPDLSPRISFRYFVNCTRQIRIDYVTVKNVCKVTEPPEQRFITRNIGQRLE